MRPDGYQEMDLPSSFVLLTAGDREKFMRMITPVEDFNFALQQPSHKLSKDMAFYWSEMTTKMSALSWFARNEAVKAKSQEKTD